MIAVTYREVSIQLPNGQLSGSLSIPEKPSFDLVIIVSGSGPTDRDGNSLYSNTFNLKILSDSLVRHGIATFRFDKRGIGKSIFPHLSEDAITIDTLVQDVVRWCEYHKNNKAVKGLYILGHSEGSLIGILTAQRSKIDGFVSVNGIGTSADQLLKKQLVNLPASLKSSAYQIVDSLKMGKHPKEVNLQLMALFRPSVQPYLISWFKYNPNEELKKVKCTCSVIQGKNDTQIGLDEAYKLVAGAKGCSLLLVDGMSHLMFNEAPRNQIGSQEKGEMNTVFLDALYLFLKN